MNILSRSQTARLPIFVGCLLALSVLTAHGAEKIKAPPDPRDRLLSRVLEAEFQFVSKVCACSDEQLEQIQQGAIERIDQFRSSGGSISSFEPELRHFVIDSIDAQLRTVLSAQQLERHREEIAAREQLRQRSIAMLVADQINRDAFLNESQLQEVEATLVDHWRRDWPDAVNIASNGIHAILPGWSLVKRHLTPLQKQIWSYRGKQRDSRQTSGYNAIEFFDQPTATKKPPEARRVRRVGRRALTDATYWFDRRCFDQLTASQARTKSERSLQARIALIEQATTLRPEQQSKVSLAGQTDIHRYFADHDDIKRALKRLGVSSAAGNRDPDSQTKSSQHADRFSAGLHGTESLYAKTVRTVLDPQQTEQVERQTEQARWNRLNRHIDIVLAMIDATLPLTAAQRESISGSLVDSFESAPALGTGLEPLHRILRQLAGLKPQLQAVLLESEWPAMQRVLRSTEPVTQP